MIYREDRLTMNPTVITSAQNNGIKHLVRLRERREREKEKLTVLEGYRELTRADEYGMTITEAWFSPELFLGENEFPLLEHLESKGARLFQVPPHLLTKVTYRDRPEGLIAVAKMLKHDLSSIPLKKDGLYLLAESIEKPGNLGSMLRSADAAGADGLIICDRQTDIYNPNVIRASTGALFSVPLAETDNETALAWLRENKILSIATTPHTDKCYTDIDMRGPVAIIMGTEQTGLTDFWLNNADISAVIPMLGKIDSLNVATATTILLYEAARQRNFKKR